MSQLQQLVHFYAEQYRIVWICFSALYLLSDNMVASGFVCMYVCVFINKLTVNICVYDLCE